MKQKNNFWKDVILEYKLEFALFLLIIFMFVSCSAETIADNVIRVKREEAKIKIAKPVEKEIKTDEKR